MMVAVVNGVVHTLALRGFPCQIVGVLCTYQFKFQSHTRRAQYPLIKEHALNDIIIPKS